MSRSVIPILREYQRVQLVIVFLNEKTHNTPALQSSVLSSWSQETIPFWNFIGVDYI